MSSNTYFIVSFFKFLTSLKLELKNNFILNYLWANYSLMIMFKKIYKKIKLNFKKNIQTEKDLKT